MSDLNQCQFIGRLGKDPEARFLTNGDAVTNFSLAVGWKTKEKEGTEWVRCVTYGKLAEIAGKYLTKGKQCYVSGRFKTRDYMKDGVKTYATEINVDQLQLLGSKDEGAATRRTAASSESLDRGESANRYGSVNSNDGGDYFDDAP